jgi:osmotically-inducible protein OsmY
MRRALRRAAIALLAAGAPGLAGPAFAQTQPPAAPLTLPPADLAREGRGRLEEMKVEMAWLADPATFPYPLVARTVDGHLELRGSVPNEAARQAAVKIARAHSHLATANLLQIDHSLAPSEKGIDSDAVRQGAVEIFNDTFGTSARGFEIRAESDGKVAVSGSVNSVEEKLAVSRRLRKVRGCTYASNYLQISPEMRDGRMVTRIDAAGSLVVSGQVLCLDGTGQDSPTVHSVPVAPPPARPAVAAPRSTPVTAVMSTPAVPVVVMPAPVTTVASVAAPVQPPTQPTTSIRPVVVQVPATTTAMQPAQRAPAATVAPVAAPVQSPATVRPVVAHIPAPTTVMQPPQLTNVPAPVMPIEVPVPTITTPVPPPSRPLASDRVPPPSMVPGRFDLLPPGPVQAQSRPAARPDASIPSLSARDSASSTVSTSRPAKEVDLLAAPKVPDSWSQSTTPPQAKANSTKSFATTRTPAPTTADELLKVPGSVAAGSDKASSTASSSTPKPATTAITTVATRPTTTGTVQSPPATAPGRPLPVPPSTTFKDTWVDAIPAPKAAPTPDHPLAPPGGWPAAHLSGPVPTPYVTSGVVVFQDEPVAPAKPVRPAMPVVESAPSAKPVTQLVSRVEPAPAPATPARMPAVVAQPALEAPRVVTPSASRMKQQVEKVCGRLASRVEVTSTEHGLVVHVKCADADAAQKVTERVLVQVPEMSDTKVKLEVEVAR